MLSRRRFLAGGLATLVGAVLAACGAAVRSVLPSSSPAVLLARGDADLLGANWEPLTRRWPENSLELEVLRLRIRLRESFAPQADPADDPR